MRQQIAGHMADHTTKYKPDTDTQNGHPLQQPKQKTKQAARLTKTQKQNHQQPSTQPSAPPIIPQNREPDGNKIHKRGNDTTQQRSTI
jgi:hypothetical protein